MTQDEQITLRFREASIKGTGGCNTYAGRYKASGESLTLSIILS